MSKDDYLSWLQIAQQTAWLEYLKRNPRSQDLLISLLNTVLDTVNDGK